MGQSDPHLNYMIVDPDPTVQSRKIKLRNVYKYWLFFIGGLEASLGF